MLDGAYGALDPAFEAHVAPLKSWATAWWERWFSVEDLEMAFHIASMKLAASAGSVWARVTGPVTAMLASLQRLGWHLPRARNARGDRGKQWDFILDSPEATAEAARHSARRWRLHRLASTMPALVPRKCDVGAPSCPEGTIVVGFAATLGQIVTGKGSRRDIPFRSQQWRGDLASAVSGGQWPQTRRAAVPAWGIEDHNCQLCHKEKGTL